ncbi:MAG: VC1465 family Xer recombination activation factor [Gallionellaceae bacterium]
MSRRRWIDPQDFCDLRKEAGLTRAQAAEASNVTRRTIQNWETGGARIPWMAYRMLRILRGYALPGVEWEGWTLRKGILYSPDNRAFPASDLVLPAIYLCTGEAVAADVHPLRTR